MNAPAPAVGGRTPPAGDAPGARSRRSPAMVWVTWRQHRFGLLAGGALLCALAAFMIVQGVGMHATYASLGLDRFSSFDSPKAASLAETFQSEYLGLGLYLPRVAMFLPLFIGAFVGAPLLAREYETGTFRFAWTQGVGRGRWVLVKVVLLGAVLTAMGLAFSLVFSWWYGPFARMMGPMPEVDGVVFAARLLFGFAAGALVGDLLRRTVPAIAVTMLVWVAVVLPTALLLRPHIQAPLLGRVDVGSKFSTEWTLSQWWVDPQGHRLGRAAYNTIARLHAADPSGWLTRHRYVLWESYQPASRFWTFQIVEASGLVLLAVALAAATVWLVRRRAA
jgi:hypothetical protein